MAAGLVSAAIRRSRLTPANAQPSGMELGGAVTPREIAQGMSTEKCFFHLRTDRYCVIPAVEIDTICESVARTVAANKTRAGISSSALRPVVAKSGGAETKLGGPRADR